eukprot:TRINITY_DN41854_c0_g1_i1.p1 TRINITY_DN41854_c0_g1~~TRINITY_DN41854_c0_g1_i1.p1  ORF type:complete len:353 (+),score=32.54 TRINITY_DN41854_c0_g1_i1:56-1114(+)
MGCAFCTYRHRGWRHLPPQSPPGSVADSDPSVSPEHDEHSTFPESCIGAPLELATVATDPETALEVGAEQLIARDIDRPLSEDETKMINDLNVAYGGKLSESIDPADWEGYATVENTNGGVGNNTALYGELAPSSCICLFRDIAGTRYGRTFYDLGSGTGKLVNLAALLGFRAIGLELEPGRHREACVARGKLLTAFSRRGAAANQLAPSPKSLPANPQSDVEAACDVQTTSSVAVAVPACAFIEAPKFVQASFVTYDFSDADIVFANSVAFNSSMMEALAVTARRMKPGRRIISYTCFPQPGFRTVEVVRLRVSWKASETCTYFVQEVLPQSGSIEPLHERMTPEAAEAVV